MSSSYSSGFIRLDGQSITLAEIPFQYGLVSYEAIRTDYSSGGTAIIIDGSAVETGVGIVGSSSSIDSNGIELGQSWTPTTSGSIYRAAKADPVIIGAGTNLEIIGFNWNALFRAPTPFTGSVATMAGFRSQVSWISAGTATNVYGYLFESPSKAGGTWTNLYGLRINDVTAGTNNWAIRTGTGAVEFGDNVTIGKSAPTLFFTDPTNDDWKIDTITGSFRIFNVTDTNIPFLVTAAGAITLGNSTAGTTLTRNVPTGASHTWQINGANIGTWSSTMFTPVTNVTISKATPLLQFTDSGGDDYSIDVGAAAASRFRIRNTTDSTTVFDVDGTNRIAMSTNYAPQTAYKVYVQDRQTAASPSSAFAALSSSMEYLPAAVTTTMNQNQHGYQGGITVFATNGSISGSGVFIGLRGDAGVQLGNALTNSQSTTGLFASMTTTQASGTGGISSLGNAVATFISAGANTTITTAAHFRVGNSSASGTITNLYGFYADAFSVGTNRYEGWMGTDAGWFFREAGNQINSRAAATLDIDATTTLNQRIGGTIVTAATAGAFTITGSIQVDSVVNDTGLAHGTYTPTLTNVANLDASTAYVCQYMRVGNTVTVSGKVDVDPTLITTSTQLGITLPVASNLANAEDCAGVAFASGIAGQGAAILGDAANNRAQMQWISTDLTNQPMYFTFTYEVI